MDSMMARPIGISREQRQRIDASVAASKQTLKEHVELTAEMAAIQEELERRVSLAKPSHRGLPWTKDRPRS